LDDLDEDMLAILGASKSSILKKNVK